MTGKEIIRRVLEYDNPPRPGFDFIWPNPSDIMADFGTFSVIPNLDVEYREWGRYPELLKKVPGFTGEVRMSNGCIFGRLGGKTNGECVYAALEDGWWSFEQYAEKYLEPYRDPRSFDLDEIENREGYRDKFTTFSVMPLQSTVRDIRGIDNMLADTVLEIDNLKCMVSLCADIAVAQVDMLAPRGADAAMMYDDWGLQHALLVSPQIWREIWKGPYARVIERLHSHGMKFLLHSCGNVWDIINDFVEIGVDAFQFDQPAIYDFEKLAMSIGNKAALWSPVDIQRILPTGDRETIRAEARRMIKTFYKGGGLIAKDYPSLGDIGVKDDWAQYARDVFYGV